MPNDKPSARLRDNRRTRLRRMSLPVFILRAGCHERGALPGRHTPALYSSIFPPRSALNQRTMPGLPRAARGKRRYESARDGMTFRLTAGARSARRLGRARIEAPAQGEIEV